VLVPQFLRGAVIGRLPRPSAGVGSGIAEARAGQAIQRFCSSSHCRAAFQSALLGLLAPRVICIGPAPCTLQFRPYTLILSKCNVAQGVS